MLLPVSRGQRLACSEVRIPDLLAICPLHLSLYEKDGKTSLVLPRPSAIAAGSPGQAKAAELEKDLTTLLEGAFQ